MKTKVAQTLILAAMLAMAPLVMAGACGNGNYLSVRHAIASWRPAVPPIWSPDGQLVLYNADAAMHWVASDGSSSKSFPHGDEPSLEHERIAGCGNAGCPPLGRLEHAFGISIHNAIVFTKLRDNGVDEPILDILTMQLDGSNRNVIATGEYPSWSPDGTRIAFFNNRGLYVMTSDGLSVKEVVKGSDYLIEGREYPRRSRMLHGSPPVWSPSGSQIAFLVRDLKWPFDSPFDAPSDIYIAQADGSGLDRIADDTVAEPAWSPDGERVAFMQEKVGVSTIYTIRPNGMDMQAIVSFPAGPRQKLTGTDAPRGKMEWSPDGSEIRVQKSPFVIVNSDGTDLRIMVFPWDTLPHYESPYPNFAAYASWSPDDAAIAVYILRGPGYLVPGLFTMMHDWTSQQVLVNEFGRYSDEELIDGLRWIDRDEYMLSLSNKALPNATEVLQ